MASTRVLFPDPVAPTRKIVLCAAEPVGLPQRKREIGRLNGANFHGVPLVAWARTKALADAQAVSPLTQKQFSCF